MRSRFILRCSTIVLAGLAVTRPCGAAEAGDSGKHFLWRVTNLDHPFYLLGSFHALRAQDYPLGKEVDQAIDQSKRFVFEFDVKRTDQTKYQKKLFDAAHYPAGVTLKQKVRPETYAYAQKIAKIRSSEYNDIKPWAIAFFMMSHPYFHNVYSYHGVEAYVMRRVGGLADVGGLESTDEHIRVLSDMIDVESEVFLLQAFVYADKNAANFSKEVAAYKRGDSDGLAAIDALKDHQAPFLTARLINHRNTLWIPRIEAEMKTGKPTMIVVGARHLCGPHNVIDLLRARGYKLEQL